VLARPARRRFTAEYNRSILGQAGVAQDSGSIGALLRRESLYSAHLGTWRRQRKHGESIFSSPLGGSACDSAAYHMVRISNGCGGVVRRLVENGSGDDRVAENRAPFAVALVEFEDDGASFVACADELEEVGCAEIVQR